MRRQCPNCKSLNVRRSSRDPEDTEEPLFRSPYRCRDCHTKFWALSTKMYRRIVLIAAVNVLFFTAMIWFIATLPD
jgi:hypothetical protein